jgi:hypothetical protein
MKILDSLIKEIMRHYLKVQVHVFFSAKKDLKPGKIQDKLKGKASKLHLLVMSLVLNSLNRAIKSRIVTDFHKIKMISNSKL